MVRDVREYMLDEIFNAIKCNFDVSEYAFKGGYVLKSILGGGVRRTTDIDLSVGRVEYFDRVIEIIEPLARKWVSDGLIYSYKINKPKKCSTGNIKFYRKHSENTRAFVYCGIDVDLHPINYGILRLDDGSNVYSIERMLSEKFWTMYTLNEKVLLHRVKDALDIYLVCEYHRQNKLEINDSLVVEYVKELMKINGYRNLRCMSMLEMVTIKDVGSVLARLEEEKMTRISDGMRMYVDNSGVITCSLNYVNYIRGLVNAALLE